MPRNGATTRAAPTAAMLEEASPNGWHPTGYGATRGRRRRDPVSQPRRSRPRRSRLPCRRRAGGSRRRRAGGRRQRGMIAIARACNPKLLIADEPTTALDVTIQAQILDLMAALKKRVGAAIIGITHDLGVVAETAERVIV